MSGMAFRFMECLTYFHNSRRPSESLLLIKRASPLEAAESLTKDLVDRRVKRILNLSADAQSPC